MRNLLRQTLLSLVLLASARAAADDAAPHWGYKGATGPSHWAGLTTEYQECKIGKFQSPIDIRGAKVAELPAIEFSYQAAPLHIINNGHTIQVNVPPGSFINLGGRRYELVQFHFHHPSETKLGGQAFRLELHLVHKDADGKLAVVGVLLADGKANPTLAGLFKYVPKEKEKESAPDGVTVDPNGMLPTNRAYYTFSRLAHDAALQRGGDVVRAEDAGACLPARVGKLRGGVPTQRASGPAPQPPPGADDEVACGARGSQRLGRSSSNRARRAPSRGTSRGGPPKSASCS